MAFNYVPYGLYFGWTRDEILAQLKKLDAAIMSRASGSGALTSASVNGKTFSYHMPGAMGGSGDVDVLAQLRREKLELQQALACIDDDYNAPTTKTIAVQQVRWIQPHPC